MHNGKKEHTSNGGTKKNQLSVKLVSMNGSFTNDQFEFPSNPDTALLSEND